MKFTILLFIAMMMTSESQSQQFRNKTSQIDQVDLEDFWTGAIFVDIDQDLDDDLILTNRIPGRIQRTSKVYINENGYFKFQKNHVISQELGYWFGLTAGDYNNDGLIDIYIAGYRGALYKNTGSGQYERVNEGIMKDPTISGICAGFTDFNNDGNLDLIISRPEWIPGAPWHGEPGSPQILINSGAPHYTFTRLDDSVLSKLGKDSYMQPTLFDYDDDNDIDIFIGMGSGVSKVDIMLKNRFTESSELSFQRMNDNALTKALVEGNQWSFNDVDNDGDWDVHVTNWANTIDGKNYPRKNFLFINRNNDYDLVEEGPIYNDMDMSTTALWGDFDNDADVDMISVSDSGFTLKYYQNDGFGNYKRIDVGDLSRTNNHQSGGSVSDIDHDGDLDVFIPGPRNNSTLFVNDLDNKNHYIKFKLEGQSSNRSGIGAQIKLTAIIDGKEITQRRNVSASNVFFGQQSLIQHFGLKSAERIKSIEITWPSGQKETHENLVADRFYLIKENSSSAQLMIRSN